MSREKIVVHEGHSFGNDIIGVTIPLLVMGVFFNGPRVLILAIVAVITAKLADRFAAFLRTRKYDPTENSSVAIAMIIVLMVPASVRFRIVIMAVLAAVLVGKEAFGGYNSYPFNPVAVGYCVAAVSWDKELFLYPTHINWLAIKDWSLGNLWKVFRFENTPMLEGASRTLKNGGIPNVDTWSLLLGDFVGPLGATVCIVILACGFFLWVKKRLPLAAPLAFLTTIALIVYLFPRAPQDVWKTLPWYYWEERLRMVQIELLSGGLIFASVFLILDPGTLPKNTSARFVYGILLGVTSILFRYFGYYDLGTCFAFLIINAVSGYFDRALAARATRSIVTKKGASA